MTDVDILHEIPKATRDLLFNQGPFDPWLRPFFGVQRFPIHYESSGLTACQIKAALQDLFAARPHLLIQDCGAYNAWLKGHGLAAPPFTWLSGQCTEVKETCKHFKRWTCGGCGRIFIPGSLNDPACTVGEYPWWYEYVKDEIDGLIADSGGVSRTDPLVWFPDGAHRHGRTVTYDPRTRISSPRQP
jgi:hypothetical protein